LTKTKKENGDLEQYKQKLESQIQNLEKEESNSKAPRDASLYNEKIINDEIEAFSNLKTQLQKYGLDIGEDIPKFVHVVDSINELGFDINKVLTPYQNSVLLKVKYDIFDRQINEMNNEKLRLEQSICVLQAQERLHAQRMYIYEELESMGLGLNKLRFLRNTIVEIAAENSISSTMAVQEFFKSLEKKHDIKLRPYLQDNPQQHNGKSPDKVRLQ
jgi:chromosome segregation ATPase